jgi:hypothetical protein
MGGIFHSRTVLIDILKVDGSSTDESIKTVPVFSALAVTSETSFSVGREGIRTAGLILGAVKVCCMTVALS